MPGYEGSSSDTNGTQHTGDTITINGTLCFMFGLEGSAKPGERDSYLGTMAKRGYKIGLRVKRDQRVERLSFVGEHGDVVLQESATVTEELDQALRCQGDERWIGLVPPKAGERRVNIHEQARRLTVCYEFTLLVSNVKCTPQPVTMVLTYADESFARHFLLHVLVLADRRRIKITTEAVY